MYSELRISANIDVNVMIMKLEKESKGISSLIASVLLIAFTVAAFGIIQLWGISFISTQTEQVSGQTETELTCIYGGISVSTLRYCNSYLGGIVENTNMIDLGNVTLQIVYQNSTMSSHPLNNSGTEIYMTLEPGEWESFNVTISGSNYNKIHLYTNCSDVYDDATTADVTAC